MVRACCVSNCKSGVNVPSHKFPKRQERCEQWVKSLNLNHLKNWSCDQLQKYKVCYKHFREEDYNCTPCNRFLLNTAVPVPFIINDSPDDVTNNNLQQQSPQEQQLPKIEQLPQQEESQQKQLAHQLSQQKKSQKKESLQKTQVLQHPQPPQQQDALEEDKNGCEQILQPEHNQNTHTNQIDQQHGKKLVQEKKVFKKCNVRYIKLQNQILEQQQEVISKPSRKRLNLQETSREVTLIPAKEAFDVLKLKHENKPYLKRFTKRKK